MTTTESQIAASAATAVAALVTLAAEASLPETAARTIGGLITQAAEASPTSATADFVTGVLEAARQIAREGDPEQVFTAARMLIAGAGGPNPIDALARVVLIAAMCSAALRRTHETRQDAQATRATVRDLAETVLGVVGAVLGPEAYRWALDITGETARILSAVAADRSALVMAETGRSLPSTLVAWRLYQDPERASGLVLRNAVATPCLMPVRFEAEAPR